MAGTKTGNKGFINPADGNKVYVMDPVAPGAPGGNEDPPAYDSGDLTVDNTVKDISAKTRITLGTYLSKLTRGEVGSTNVPNKYSVDPSSSASQPLQTTTNGYPTPPAISDNSEQFKQVLPSAYSQEYVVIQQSIKKGLGPADVADGNTLLPTATKNDSSTTLSTDSPISDYTIEVSSKNRWKADGSTFTSGEDPANPSAGFNVPLLSSAPSGLPSQQVSTQGIYQLGLDVATAKAADETQDNDFPLVASPNTNLVSTTTNGVPSPPIQAPNGFAPQLPSSFSNDYAAASLTEPDGLQKGKTGLAGPSGHEFIAGVQIAGGEITSPVKLVEYTSEVVSSNRYIPTTNGTGFSSSAEVESPPTDFNPKLQSLATAVLPNQEATDSTNAKFELGLEKMSSFPAEITENNDYPVVAPSITSLATTQTYDGYPAPLTPPPNQNSGPDGSFIHAPNLPATPSPEGMKKGKASVDVPDGHELLGSSFKEGPSGVVPPQPVEKYVTEITQRNEFDSSSPLLAPEFNVVDPPANYEARIADTNEKGKYESAEKKPVTLETLRMKPGDDTQRNKYPVDKDMDQLQSLVDPATKLPPTSLVDTSNNNFFVPRDNIKPLSYDPSVSNFAKGKGGATYDGHNLLPSVDGNNRTSDPQDKYSKSYVSKGDAQYTTTGTSDKDSTPKDHPLKTYKGDRGSTILALGNNRFSPVIPPATFNPEYTMKDGTKIKAMKMAQVGYALSQRASSEIPGVLGSPFNPTGAGAEAGAILPSVSQLGILKVDDVLLSAQDALDSINEDYPVDSLSQIAYFENQSWGNLTNVSEPYDDAFSGGLLLTAAAMMIALKILFLFFFAWWSDSSAVKDQGKGKYFMGRYRDIPEWPGAWSIFPTVYDVFGLYPTRNDFNTCMDVGFNAYFLSAAPAADLADRYSNVGELLGIFLAKNARDSQNMYVPLMTCRTIVRSGILLAVALVRIVNQPNVMSQVRGVLNIMRTIRSSKFIAAANVFSQLGDTVYESTKKIIKVRDVSGKDTEVDITDSAAPGVHSAVRKSRLGNSSEYDPTLSWSSARAPAMYLVSKKVKLVADNDIGNELGSFKGLSALKSEKVDNAGKDTSYYRHRSSTDSETGTDKGRIDGTLRSTLENALEAEYVPFYFHDVRTNEIVSFHAFLTSLSDDYSASYDSSEGIGRIEPIKIYKGTTRKIGLSFYIAATNEEDFNHMWYKINKLTTLVYPQYTKGKMLSGKDYNFRAPFSQLVGASPLIRIRLGEILRSNYSRFALARLFGLTDGDANIPVFDEFRKTTANLSLDSKDADVKKGDLKKELQVEEGDVVVLQSEARAKLYESFRIEYMGGDYSFNDELANEIFGGRNIEWKVTRLNGTGGALLTSTMPIFESPETSSVRLTSAPARAAAAKVSKDLLVPVTSLEIITKAKEKDPGKETVDAISAISSFMNPEKNTIVKSFESAGGKGLAGFIETMNFDWYSNTNWEISPGFSAPKMCKVTISFSPIHDISPGLDHKGYNRAPIYPVGNAMRAAKTAAPTTK